MFCEFKILERLTSYSH